MARPSAISHEETRSKEGASPDRDQQLARNYDRAASFYEVASHIFSAGQIRASKLHAVAQIQPGDRTVFLGVGTGEEVLSACQKGARVTCVDLSPGMLQRLQHRLAAEGQTAEIICGNVLEHDRPNYYDVVVANYFLNVFVQADLLRMLHRVATLTRPGGKVLIADVAQAQGNPLARLFNILYLKFAMVSLWFWGLVPLHRNYDYTQYFDRVGLILDQVRYFRFLRFGPVLFQTLVAHRKESVA